MIMDNCVERNADVGDKLIDCSNCDVILESKQTCAKCGKQQKFNVIIVCFCAMTIAINIILVVTIFSNVNKYKSLQDSIVLLQSQVSSIKRKHDVMASDFLPDKQVCIKRKYTKTLKLTLQEIAITDQDRDGRKLQQNELQNLCVMNKLTNMQTYT